MISRDEIGAAIISEVERLDLIRRASGPYEALASGRVAIFSYLLNGIEDKRILDIGCGGCEEKRRDFGMYGSPKVYGKGYEPHFCRLAKKLSANPVGIDPRVDTQESFEAHKASIFDPLNLLQESFDGVLISLFWSDPSVCNARNQRESQNSVYRHVRQLLKPGGYSLNIGNSNGRHKSQLHLSNKDFEDLGLEVLGYFDTSEIFFLGGEDLIILRKPLEVVETL